MSEDFGPLKRYKPSEQDWTQRLTKLRAMATEHGWKEIDHQTNILLLIFDKGGIKCNVYYSRMTVVLGTRQNRKTYKPCKMAKLNRLLADPPITTHERC